VGDAALGHQALDRPARAALAEFAADAERGSTAAGCTRAGASRDLLQRDYIVVSFAKAHAVLVKAARGRLPRWAPASSARRAMRRAPAAPSCSRRSEGHSCPVHPQARRQMRRRPQAKSTGAEDPGHFLQRSSHVSRWMPPSAKPVAAVGTRVLDSGEAGRQTGSKCPKSASLNPAESDRDKPGDTHE
jgi:hypothetical protein